MTTTIGSGLGGFAAIVNQPTYGATFVTPTRTLTALTAKMTYDPHIVQGGPYIRDGAFVDIGSAHVATWLDAKGTLTGNVMSIGQALLLASAMGTGVGLTQIGTTSAYGIGGSAGVSLGIPDKNNGGTLGGCQFDMQLGVPTTDGTLHPENYHSTIITKAEWVFDRGAITTFSYDVDSEYVEKSTALITPSVAGAPAPFTMSNAASAFKVGTFGSEAQVDGIRKCTITLERKMDVSRAYLGNPFKDIPVTNDNVTITVALEVDYTTAAKTWLFDLFLAGTPTSIVCSSIGAAIGASGYNNTFQLTVPNAFVQTGGESPLDGPALVKNTITLMGTLDSASDLNGLGLLYITADTAF